MREIKFRGYSSHDDEFKYGSFIDNSQSDFDSYIQDDSGNFLIIERDTVGQFTGLKDKNGTPIYEGDILLIDSEKYIIIFEYGCFIARNFDDDDDYVNSLEDISEVIGNIYEHPHLLEGDK